MRTRQIELLHILLHHQKVDCSKVLYIYKISRRTLFYDLEEINYRLKDLGRIKVENDCLIIEGNLKKVEEYLVSKVFNPFF